MSDIAQLFYNSFLDKTDVTSESQVYPISEHCITDSVYLDEWVKEQIKALTLCAQSELEVDGLPIRFSTVGSTTKEVGKYHLILCKALISYVRFLTLLHPNINKPKPMRVFIYLTGLKKTLPKATRGTLMPINVNTGFTVFDPQTPYNTIVIYRKEEAFKVLIHELTHYYHIDRIPIPTSLKDEVKDLFKITNDPHLNEAITDFWACYVNILFDSIFKKDGSLNDVNDYNNNIGVLLKKEIDFIKSQAQKVIGHVNMCQPVLSNESTHVISYYVIKAVMFHNFASYITDYKNLEAKPYFVNNIIKDTKNFMFALCGKKYTRINKTTLRMSSVDVISKMKTI